MSKPHRIQLSRKKGFKLSPNTVTVARPGRFGNPFTVKDFREAGIQGTDEEIAARCVDAFRAWLGPDGQRHWNHPDSERRQKAILDSLTDLKGKNLACWCRLGAPCHGEVILELANNDAATTSD